MAARAHRKQAVQRSRSRAGQQRLMRRLPLSAKPLYQVQSPGQLPARLQACQLHREAMQRKTHQLQHHRLQARHLCRVCKKRPGQRKPISAPFPLITALEDCMGADHTWKSVQHIQGDCALLLTDA